MRPYRVAFPVRSVERLGRDVRREVGDAGAQLSAGPQAGRIPLERGLQGIHAALLPGAEALVQLPAHAREQLKTLVAFVDLHLRYAGSRRRSFKGRLEGLKRDGKRLEKNAS